MPALATALLVTWRWSIFACTPGLKRFTSRIEALHRWSSTSWPDRSRSPSSAASAWRITYGKDG